MRIIYHNYYTNYKSIITTNCILLHQIDPIENLKDYKFILILKIIVSIVSLLFYSFFVQDSYKLILLIII